LLLLLLLLLLLVMSHILSYLFGGGGGVGTTTHVSKPAAVAAAAAVAETTTAADVGAIAVGDPQVVDESTHTADGTASNDDVSSLYSALAAVTLSVRDSRVSRRLRSQDETICKEVRLLGHLKSSMTLPDACHPGRAVDRIMALLWPLRAPGGDGDVEAAVTIDVIFQWFHQQIKCERPAIELHEMVIKRGGILLPNVSASEVREAVSYALQFAGRDGAGHSFLGAATTMVDAWLLVMSELTSSSAEPPRRRVIYHLHQSTYPDMMLQLMVLDHQHGTWSMYTQKFSIVDPIADMAAGDLSLEAFSAMLVQTGVSAAHLLDGAMYVLPGNGVGWYRLDSPVAVLFIVAQLALRCDCVSQSSSSQLLMCAREMATTLLVAADGDAAPSTSSTAAPAAAIKIANSVADPFSRR